MQGHKSRLCPSEVPNVHGVWFYFWGTLSKGAGERRRGEDVDLDSVTSCPFIDLEKERKNSSRDSQRLRTSRTFF